MEKDKKIWQRKYYQKNREKILKRIKKWNKKHRKQRAENQQKYRKRHPERIKDQQKKYLQKNGERIRQQEQARRLRLRFQILQRDDFTCQYCGRKAPKVILEIDHIYPKSKGGKDNIKNYKTACRECNLGKGDIILNEFL